MPRHAAFAPTETKVDSAHHDSNPVYSGTGDGASSLAPTGTRGTDPEKSSMTGLTHREQNRKSVRKLLVKLGEHDTL
jgi:hypothetical protein